MITITIARDDGEVSRFEGPAAIGLCMQGDVELPEDGIYIGDLDALKGLLKTLENMPVVSLRCDNLLQAVIMAGTLVGWIYGEGGGEALEAVSLVASIAGFKEGEARQLP